MSENIGRINEGKVVPAKVPQPPTPNEGKVVPAKVPQPPTPTTRMQNDKVAGDQGTDDQGKVL